jgi:hypothetical protein
MNDGRELTVEFTLIPEDVYSPFRWDRNNLARWIASALLCYILYDVYSRSVETLRTFEGGTSIIAILITLFILVLAGLLLFPLLRLRAVFRGTPGFATLKRVTFRPDLILFESESAKAECKWTLFLNVLETPRVFVFSQGKVGATYIPKRCFTSSEDIAFLRKLIRENFKGKITLRRD